MSCHKLTSTPVADDGVGRPEQRVAVAEQCFALVVGITRSVEQRHHRLPQSFTAREFRIGALSPEQIADEFARRLRMYRPVGYQNGPRASIEECASEPGSCFRTGACACASV